MSDIRKEKITTDLDKQIFYFGKIFLFLFVRNDDFCSVMKYKHQILKNRVVFSKWTRKNYAIFASLHKIVKINRLAIDICDSSFHKNKFLLRFLNIGAVADIQDNEFEEEKFICPDWLIKLLIELGLISAEKLYSVSEININNNITKPRYC